MDVTVQAAWIGVVGTIAGGTGFKLIEYWSANRKSKNADQETAIELRDELREDVQNLRKELRQVEEDLQNWRGKYYDLLENFISVKQNLEGALRHIEQENKGLTDPPEDDKVSE